MSQYKGFRIKQVHAIVAIGDDDEECIPAFFRDGQWMPLIAADPERLKSITAMAQDLADHLRKNFKIVRFSTREEIGEIKSRTLS